MFLRLTPGASSTRLKSTMKSPTFWHWFSMGAGLVFVLWLQRHQWFFGDEWAFLELNGDGALDPHVGHWSTSPYLALSALRDLFGLNSYLPFVVGPTVFHLAIAHVTWRITNRSGTNPWIATAAVGIMIVLGAGAENILWGFQIGFLGGLLFGLIAFLIATSDELTRGNTWAIFALSVFSLTWSGTAIPIAVATAAMLWHRHGHRMAMSLVAVTATVYLSWYVAFAVGNGGNPDTGGLTLEKVIVQIPQFVGVLLILGYQHLYPVPGLGSIALVALLVWLIRVRRRHPPLRDFAPALILTGGAALFALMTAYNRAAFSVGSGQASRYTYVSVLLLLPLSARALTYWSDKGRRRVQLAAAFCVVLIAYQAFVLTEAAGEQAAREQASHRLISASLALYVSDPQSVELSALPDAGRSPDITLQDIVDLYEDGLITVQEFDEDDLTRARANVERTRR